MTAKSYQSGHEIYYDEEKKKWLYCDTKESRFVKRPCKKCGRFATPEGYDACLGHLEGINSACCGHGVEEPYATKRGKKVTKI